MKLGVCLVLKKIIVIMGIKMQEFSSLLIQQLMVRSLLRGKKADSLWFLKSMRGLFSLSLINFWHNMIHICAIRVHHIRAAYLKQVHLVITY